MPTRKEVFDAIESERSYQESLWGKTETKGLHSISEFIAYMEDYQLEAKHILARTKKVDAYPQAIEIMRKIVAMGVNCMEQHGAPHRKPAVTKTTNHSSFCTPEQCLCMSK